MYYAIFSQQRGAVLISVFILLTIMSLIIVTMSTSSITHERSSANKAYMNKTHQAAESSIKKIFNIFYFDGDTSLMSDAMNASDSLSAEVAYEEGESHIDTTYQIEHLGNITISEGESINSDESSSNLSGAYFEIKGAASQQNNGTTTTIRQGILYQ